MHKDFVIVKNVHADTEYTTIMIIYDYNPKEINLSQILIMVHYGTINCWQKTVKKWYDGDDIKYNH